MSSNFLNKLYQAIENPTILGLIFILFIFFICWLILRKFSNKHSDFIRYYLSQNNIEIEYFYIQRDSQEKIFSPKFSKLFSSKLKFKNLESLEKIIDKTQINNLQDLISKQIQELKKKTFNNKRQAVLEFIDDKGVARSIEAKIEALTEVENCPIGIVVWFRDVTINLQDTKRMEEELNQLRAEKKLYYDILNNTSIPIWARNNNNQVVYHNNEYQKLVNITNDSSDKSIPELTKSSTSIAKKARALQNYEEDKYIFAKNERKLFSIREKLFRDDYLLGIALDQSEKEKIKDELKQYSDVQNNFLESSSSAVAIYMADQKIKYFNQAFINLWGLDEKWLFTNPTYGEILEELRQRRKLPEQANFLDYKKGHLKLFTQLPETHNEFMYLPDGKVLRMIVIPFAIGGLLFAFEDMTSHLVLERSFNSLNAVQKAMLNNLSEAIAVFGQDGRLKVYNPAYLKLLDMETEYADSSPHISDIIESKKHLFQVRDSNWTNIKNDLISVLYEREFQRIILKMNNGIIIHRTVAPLPDGATLITYVNNSNLVECQALVSEKNIILNDFFLNQHQLIINIGKQLNFLSSNLQKEIKDSKINSDSFIKAFDKIKNQTKEMLSVSKINLESVNTDFSVIDIEKLINESIKKSSDSINIKKVSFLLKDNYYNSIITNYTRVSMILEKILNYITDLTNKNAVLNIEVHNDTHNLIIKFIVTKNKTTKISLEQKFLLIQSILEVYNEKLLLSVNENGFTLVLNISQSQVNKIIGHNE